MNISKYYSWLPSGQEFCWLCLVCIPQILELLSLKVKSVHIPSDKNAGQYRRSCLQTKLSLLKSPLQKGWWKVRITQCWARKVMIFWDRCAPPSHHQAVSLRGVWGRHREASAWYYYETFRTGGTTGGGGCLGDIDSSHSPAQGREHNDWCGGSRHRSGCSIFHKTVCSSLSTSWDLG